MKVRKQSGKPFKSRQKVNTVKGATINPNTGKFAFTFFEDDSVVNQEICVIAGKEEVVPHPTVRLSVGDMEGEIDVEIAPLISVLWQRGVRTEYCCQGGFETKAVGALRVTQAYISFAPGQHASMFGNLMIKELGFPEKRVWGEQRYGMFLPNGWTWECIYTDRHNDFVIVSRFPYEDVILACNVIHERIESQSTL